MKNNSMENARAGKRILGTETLSGKMKSRLLLAAREIMKHGEAQLASGSGLVVTCESDGTRTTNAVVKGYNWVPDDVLCRVCFTAIFYYTWWLEERRTKRVEGELLSLMTKL
jgi:hypothetical protein